jgi:excisionase family DNA binding protein
MFNLCQIPYEYPDPDKNHPPKSTPQKSPKEVGSGEERRLFTVEELAEYLNISEEMVYKLNKTKKIPVIMLGAAIRFDRKAIDQWIGQNTTRGGFLS